MIEVLCEPFEHDGDQYVVRVVQDAEGTYRIRAFDGDGRPVNPYVYTADVDTNRDFQLAPISEGQPLWRHLADEARNDVTTQRWERYVASCRAARQ